MRKSITTRYFYATALLLIASTALMGFIQMYLSMVFFRAQSDRGLLLTVDNTIQILQEVQADHLNDTEARALMNREITLTARASDNNIFVTDVYGRIVLGSTKDPVEYIEEYYIDAYLPEKAVSGAYNHGRYTQMGTLDGLLPVRSYIAGKPVRIDGDLTGYVFATADADMMAEFLANLFSTFLLSAGLMLMVSSVISIVMTSRLTTPLRRLAEAAGKFGSGDFSARVPVEGDDELAAVAIQFNNMAQSLERTDTSRRSFMGNIAHELRTPMTSIKGFIDGMLDGTIPQDDYRHYLEIVSNEAGRLTRLVKNMLDITKLEAGEYQPNAAPYDIWESLTSAVFSAEQRLKEKKIRLAGFAPVRTIVNADQDLVHQVIYNILDNAIKFTPPEGEISFSVDSMKTKGMVTVSIRNTGKGIAPDSLEYVFDRFYKEDKSRGLNTTGSGLGLHICKVLIQLSGGQIWVESEEDEYCEFFFTLPAGEKPERKKYSKEIRASF